MANSVDPDQTAHSGAWRSSLIWVYIVCLDMSAWKFRIIEYVSFHDINYIPFKKTDTWQFMKEQKDLMLKMKTLTLVLELDMQIHVIYFSFLIVEREVLKALYELPSS